MSAWMATVNWASPAPLALGFEEFDAGACLELLSALELVTVILSAVLITSVTACRVTLPTKAPQ